MGAQEPPALYATQIGKCQHTRKKVSILNFNATQNAYKELNFLIQPCAETNQLYIKAKQNIGTGHGPYSNVLKQQLYLKQTKKQI